MLHIFLVSLYNIEVSNFTVTSTAEYFSGKALSVGQIFQWMLIWNSEQAPNTTNTTIPQIINLKILNVQCHINITYDDIMRHTVIQLVPNRLSLPQCSIVQVM